MGNNAFDSTDDDTRELEVQNLIPLHFVTEAAEYLGQHLGIIGGYLQVVVEPAQ
jgi:hypothetical protein